MIMAVNLFAAIVAFTKFANLTYHVIVLWLAECLMCKWWLPSCMCSNMWHHADWFLATVAIAIRELVAVAVAHLLKVTRCC